MSRTLVRHWLGVRVCRWEPHPGRARTVIVSLSGTGPMICVRSTVVPIVLRTPASGAFMAPKQTMTRR